MAQRHKGGGDGPRPSTGDSRGAMYPGLLGPQTMQLSSEAHDVTNHQAQGSEYVLVFVKLFIASCTPSLYPSPESLMPPKGVNSKR